MARRTKKFSPVDLDALAGRIRSLFSEGESMNAFCRRVGGISSGAMSDYVNAHKMPTLETLAQIALVCQVSLDWLATGRASGAAIRVAQEEAVYNAKRSPSPRMAALLDNYENLSEGDKRALEHLAFSLAKPNLKDKAA
jgi:transcriptional regulator with XRE-family HTH domain